MRHPRPGRLPADPSDLPAVTRPLVVDSYLGRDDVIREIATAIDIDVDLPTDTLTHQETAALLRHADDSETRPTEQIASEDPKYDIIVTLAELYGFKARDDQSSMIKSQLVFILLDETTDLTPDPFELPSDPDITLYDQHGDTPGRTDMAPMIGGD